MNIRKELFDECWEPAEGIKRICLRGDRILPEELVNAAKRVDGDDYEPSCFAVDLNGSGGMICYMDTHNGYTEICPIDNWQEAEEHYDKWMSVRCIRVMMKSGEFHEIFTGEDGDMPDEEAIRLAVECGHKREDIVDIIRF